MSDTEVIIWAIVVVVVGVLTGFVINLFNKTDPPNKIV